MRHGAYIFGCSGLNITSQEIDFFRECSPWGFILFARNVENPDQLRGLCADLRTAVGWHAPILIDQEGGRVQRLRAPHWREFLPPLEQSQISKDPATAMLLRGALIGADLAGVGIDVNCAPTLDIAGADTHPFLRNRCLSEDPNAVAQLGQALVDGMAMAGVASVMKHLPGHGRGKVDSHLELPRTQATQAELTQDIMPFQQLNQLSMGMSAHIVVEAIDPIRPATQSPDCIDFIRNDIGFNGLLMTDDISMQALHGSAKQRAKLSLDAGCDVVLHCNGDLTEMQAIAELGLMNGVAQSRADRAAQNRPDPSAIDIEQIEADFNALMLS